MSDRFAATLTVRRADYEALEELKRLIDMEEKDSFDNAIVEIRNDAARYGEFEEIEEFCTEHGIAFDRWSEAYYEYQSQMRMYRPGAEPIDKIVFLSSSGEPFVGCRDIRQILEDMKLAADERILRAIEIGRESDYPCPTIENYRSEREQEARVC